MPTVFDVSHVFQLPLVLARRAGAAVIAVIHLQHKSLQPPSKLDGGGGTSPEASTESPEASVQGLGGGTNPEASKNLK